MLLRLAGPWQQLNAANVAALGGYLGVYGIRKADGEVVMIGMAGARTLFGLRSELTQELENRGADGFEFMVEVNMQYQSRYAELLMVHEADFGELPVDNRASPPPNLGRLSPAGG